MLQISYIRENKDLVINGLKKRNFKELELVEEAIALDEQRRLIQTKLDQRDWYANEGRQETRSRTG